MATIIDITDKLNFEEKPQIKIKDITLTINDDAITVLEAMANFEDPTPQNVLQSVKLLLAAVNMINYSL